MPKIQSINRLILFLQISDLTFVASEFQILFLQCIGNMVRGKKNSRVGKWIWEKSGLK